MADKMKERAEILAMAKARGKTLKPEHEAELQRYEQMGVVAGPEGKTRAMSDGAAKRYEESIGTYAALKSSAGSFKPDFAGNTITGGLENSVQSLAGDFGTPGQRDWWSNFRASDNAIRNSLFGSALTDTEKKAYEETTISERMDPDIIRQNLDRRQEIIRAALARQTNFMKKNRVDPEAVDALAGEFSGDFASDYKGKSDIGAGESKSLEMGFDIQTPTNWRASEEDQQAFSRFVSDNRGTLTPELLNTWLQSRKLPTLSNAGDYVKGVQDSPDAPTMFNYDLLDKRAREDAEKRVREDLPLSNPVVAAAAGVGDVIPGRDKIIAGVKTAVNDRTYSDNLARTRADAEVIAEDNPWSTLAGNVGGLITGARGMTRAVPKLAELMGAGSSGSQMAKGILADGAYGGVRGAVNSDDDAVLGAIKGGGEAMAGSAAGRAIGKAAQRALSPVGNASVDLLRSKGVRVTPGQALGPVASKVEEKLQSVPFVGDMIRSGRDRAEGDFNAAVINEALAPLGTKLPDGVKGTQAMSFAQKAFSDAYDKAREGMSLVADQEVLDSLKAIAARGDAGEISDETAKRIQKIYDTHVGRRLAKGIVSGKDYKEMHSALGKLASGARKNENRELASTITDLQATLDAAAARSSAPNYVEAMARADEGYAQFVRAENAAKARGGDAGSFSAVQYDRAVQAGDDSVRSKAYLRGDALGQPLASAGKDILRDQVPDSGTAGRLAMGALVGGGTGLASYFDPTGTAPYVAGGLAAMYLPGARDVATRAIAGKRPAEFKKLGDLLINQSSAAGAFGVAPTLTGN